MSLLTNCFKLGSIVLDKNYCMTAEEMKNIDPSLFPNVFPIWCTDDNCLYMMYKQNNGTIKIENLKEMDWTDNPTILYPVINNGKLTWELKYISGIEEIPEVNIIGKSAYEIWKDLGNSGTEEDFINSLKGADGEDGVSPIIEIGANGNWYVNNVDTGASAKGDKGDPGKSAYEVWKESDESNADKTEADFLASLKGEKGIDGVDGEKGEDGVSPHIGANGNWFVGEYDTNTPAHGEDGTDGINGKSAYEVWKEQGNEGTEDDFVTYMKGEQGISGKSAYEIWKERGNEGTEEEFLASLKGEPGEAGVDGEDGLNGTDGKSAYEVWKDLGNSGTEEDFINSLKGEPGEAGVDGTNGEDGTDGINGKSAYEIWRESNETNINKSESEFLASLKGEDGVDGLDGKSAYEVWKAIGGNEDKTEEDFFNSLKVESEYKECLDKFFPLYNDTVAYEKYDIVKHENTWKMWNNDTASTPGDNTSDGWIDVVNNDTLPFKTLREYISLLVTTA